MADSRPPNYGMATKKAEEVLKENYVSQPPVRIHQIVGTYGLTVLPVTLPEKYESVAGFIDLENQAIMVNANDAVTRQTFTLAHELAHWLLHREYLATNPGQSILLRLPIGKTNTDPLEKEANCFAANLLVPDKFLRLFVGADSQLLAKMFCVSPEVMGYRLANRSWG